MRFCRELSHSIRVARSAQGAASHARQPRQRSFHRLPSRRKQRIHAHAQTRGEDHHDHCHRCRVEKIAAADTASTHEAAGSFNGAALMCGMFPCEGALVVKAFAILSALGLDN